MTRVLFAVLLVAAFGMFAWTVLRFARLIFSARPQDRTDRVGARIDSVMRFFFSGGLGTVYLGTMRHALILI